MRGHRAFVMLMSWAALTMLPVAASAQAQFDLPVTVAVGQTVRVTSTDGKVTKGKIRTLTPASVIFEAPSGSAKQGKEPVNLAVADVRRIQLPDSVADGVVKGALTGGLTGWLVGTVFDAGAAVGDLFGASLGLLLGAEVEPVNRSSGAKTGTLLGVFFGAAVGYALDDGKMKTIYEREDGEVTVNVRPIASAAGKGVGVQVRW